MNIVIDNFKYDNLIEYVLYSIRTTQIALKKLSESTYLLFKVGLASARHMRQTKPTPHSPFKHTHVILLIQSPSFYLLILSENITFGRCNILGTMTRNKPTRIFEMNVSREEESDSFEATKLSLDLRIITHNIRYATTSPFPGEERWLVRCPHLCSQLIFSSVLPETFICLQEVLHQQVVDVLASLNAMSPVWAYVGVGRDDGKENGEYSPIFYRTSIWKLTGFETKWLSATPEIPSKGWDASCIRIVTIGHFTHLETGKKVIVLSTHFDNDGSESRKNSAQLILEKIESMTANGKVSVILLAGDFNSPPDDAAYKVMTSPTSMMEDVGLQIPAAKRYGNEMTFTSFGYVDNRPSRIDFIFARKRDDIIYQTYGVLPNRFDDGVYLSDHRACVADVTLRS
jgi:endonuclease/exonuclease/phosphatase family metal-dependent hydrolase